MNRTGIEYLTHTWNVTHGCTPVSDGCKNCWAKGMAERLACMPTPGYSPDDPFKVVFCPEKLDEPLRVKKPAAIGVSFMGDLFHANIPFGFVCAVFGIINKTPRHKYIILTKRPERMVEFDRWLRIEHHLDRDWPENIIAGTSIEDQKTADERAPELLRVRAACRMVSYEPALGMVNLTEWFYKTPHIDKYRIDGVIMGGESGHNARPMHPDWARSMRDQCADAGVDFMFKQWGEWKPWEQSDGDSTRYQCNYTRVTPDGHNKLMIRVGKKAAGNLLDGVVHDTLPEILK